MRKLFYLLFALPLAMVACNTPEGEQDIVTLEVTSDKVIAFAAEGGEGVITYTLNVEALPVVTTEAEWITIDSVAENIEYSVAPNVEYAERSAVITVSYNDLKADVTVNQAAAQSEDWTIVGSMTNNWDVASAIAMEEIDGYYAAYGVDISSSDSFKFILDGSMQNGLCGNGQPSERDCKYPAQKYGSDIRVKESGTYDLYINKSLTTYYVMSEGKGPAEAQETVAPDENVWYVSGIGEEIRMHNAGVFLVASNVALDADGFKIRHTSTGSYGTTTDTEFEVGDEISVVANAENNHGMNADNLYVSTVIGNAGPILKRGRIASRRGFVRINKRTTHITIGVSEKA